MKVLVVGAANAASLAIAQTLAPAGIDVDVVGFAGDVNKTLHSRHVEGRYLGPALSEPIDSLADFVAPMVGCDRYDLVVPTNDRTALLLACPQVADTARPGSLAVSGMDALLEVTDKAKVARLAERVGCPIPQTKFTDAAFVDDLEREAVELHYPCFIRPRFTWSVEGGRFIRHKPVHVADAAQFCDRYRQMHERLALPLIQQPVRGPGWGIELLAHDGTVTATFAHRRIRETNPTGSGACAAESILPDPAYLEYVRAMVRHSGYDGVCMFEFKGEAEGGRACLIEVNARFWGTLPLAVRSGVNFPRLLLDQHLGAGNADRAEYRIGTRIRRLAGELNHLRHVLRGPPAGWNGDFPTLGNTLAGLLESLPGPGYNLDAFDLRPGLVEMGGALSKALSRALRPAGI